jgi:hypothetical protein
MGKSENCLSALILRHLQKTRMQLSQAVFACSCGQLAGRIPKKWHYAEKLEIFAVSSALCIPEGRVDVK